MSSGSRRATRHQQEKDDEVPQWIPGLGSDKPKPRTLGTSFFGYVPDAFVEKTPYLPSERTADSAKKQAELEKSTGQRSESASEISEQDATSQRDMDASSDEGVVTEEVIVPRRVMSSAAEPWNTDVLDGVEQLGR
ncbi:uncharacterized protein LOC134784175 [Penaeus indicus]|uniref:uncharacterized protein LOC134784175 n=1 Tax=Penaeus indicus TaxID=29960 RepID=UPI00300D6D05